MLKVNGNLVEGAGMSVEEYLNRENFDSRTVAVELNGEIVSRDEFSDTILQDGDVMEIISFMGGGRSQSRYAK